jgi:predicted metal-dependent RNase
LAAKRCASRHVPNKSILVKITPIGAAGGEVTGSCYSVETKNARILVDCGLFQGGKKSEALNRPPLAPNRKCDAVILTHGHLDHTGRLPLLSRMGYSGPVYVKAKIHTLGGFSAHAGQTDLLHWFSVIAPGKPRVILTHGEDDQRAALAKMIQQKFRLPSVSPAMGEVIEL